MLSAQLFVKCSVLCDSFDGWIERRFLSFLCSADPLPSLTLPTSQSDLSERSKKAGDNLWLRSYL